MTVRHVLAHEGDRLKAIRLHSLQADPEGFSSTYEREEDWWTSRAALSDAGEEQRTFVVVDEGDRWLGMALVRRDETGEAVMNAMWVAPEARGSGAATALCDACAAWAGGRGFDSIDVGVFPGNTAARGMYESAGFVGHAEKNGELILRRSPARPSA
jgi:ribosomal protein S18 acetylase RimI-like enzyme